MAKLEIPSTEFATELTRGNLKAAMAAADATNPHALWQVPYGKIRVMPGFNARIRTPEYEAHVEWVTNSILENGFYQNEPLAGFVAREGDEEVIYLTAGHTRYEASGRAIERGAPIETLPMVIKPKGTSMEDLTVALVTENSGRPLTPMESAIVVKRLLGYGLDEERIAKRLGYTTKYVGDLLVLIEAPKPVRDMIATGRISSTLALQTIAKHGAKAAEKLKEAVAKAEASGKKKATGKHVDSGNAAAPRKAKVAKEISAADVFADAVACGLVVDPDEVLEMNDSVLRFAATLLSRFGVEVYKEEPAGDDPAEGL